MKKALHSTLFISLVVFCETITAITIYKQCYKYTFNNIKYKKCSCDCYAQRQRDNGMCTRCWHKVVIYDPKLTADENATAPTIVKMESDVKDVAKLS